MIRQTAKGEMIVNRELIITSGLLRKLCLGVLIFILSGAFSGCGLAKNEIPSRGTLEGSVYTNPYFDLTMEIPTPWTAIDGVALNASRGIEMPELEEGNVEGRFSLERPMRSEGIPLRYLVMLFKENPLLDLDEELRGVAAITILFENIYGYNVENGEAYLEYLKTKLVENATISNISAPFIKETIGGAKFTTMTYTEQVDGLTCTVRHSAHKKDRYILQIVTVSYSKEDDQMISDALGQLEIKYQ